MADRAAKMNAWIADDDHDLEEVEDGRDGITTGISVSVWRMKIRPMKVRIRMWPGEHVREETDAQRDQPHELAEDLERHDQRAAAPSAPRGSSS